MDLREMILMLQGATIVECLLLAIFFISNKRYGHRINSFLSVYLLLRAVQFINIILNRSLSSYSSELPSHLVGAAFGPVILLFIYAHLGKIRSWKTKHILVILPPVLYVVLWYLIPESWKGDTSLTNLLDVPVDLIYIIYIGIGLYSLYRFKKANPESTVNAVVFRLLKFLLYLSLVQVSSYYLFVLFNGLGMPALAAGSILLYFLLILFFVNGLIFLMLKYPSLSFDSGELKKRLQKGQFGKYDYSDLTKKEALEILDKLALVIRNSELYKNPSLKLEDVAHSIGAEPKDLSQSMNQYLQKSFKEYLNEIKIREAARMLQDPEYAEWRINEVMYEVGFNSKSSFNTLFKKMNGSTPRDYRLTFANQSLESAGERL